MAESENLNEFLGEFIDKTNWWIMVFEWETQKPNKQRETSFSTEKVLLDEEIILISSSSLKVSRIVALIFCNHFRVRTVDFKEKFEWSHFYIGVSGGCGNGGYQNSKKEVFKS